MPTAPLPTLEPLALKDAPALIEAVFPAQKVSFEAQRERKAGAGQTLTALGSYWKGRKPLILVRAILLGCLLPQTEDPEQDLALFEQLMAFDTGGLARRALANNAFRPDDLARALTLANPWDYFSYKVQAPGLADDAVAAWTFPLDPGRAGIRLRWRKDCTEAMRLDLYARMLATLPNYEARAGVCKRPEELDPDWLYAPVWPAVNARLGRFGVQAANHQALIEQLGILRFGHRPRVGDTFCGGGSIPFEAARLGCDVYASDLNPIACMLTWGALHIIGAPPARRAEIEAAQRAVADAVDREITALGIEHDRHGNRAKAYLYCLETRCPQTGWLVPLAPSWVISKNRNVVARLVPDPAHKRFDIEVHSGVSAAELAAAAQGTVRDGNLTYPLDGRTWTTPIRTIRGDYRDADGNGRNRLRRWERHDFRPRPDDIFQERLYCIQWITAATLHEHRPETFFAAVTDEDLAREARVEAIVAENLARWQAEGLVPDMAIEPGDKTNEPIRTRGWAYWHHLFGARSLLGIYWYRYYSTNPAMTDFEAHNIVKLPMVLDNASKLCTWNTGHPGSGEYTAHVFYNQALNTHYSYSLRSISHIAETLLMGNPDKRSDIGSRESTIVCGAASHVVGVMDFFITDPPYADAVHYHEITEYFIAWLRKNPPPPFDQWVWDSRRDLAIKGSGDDFRRGMVAAYRAMTAQMPDQGMQCVMFTHQDTGVWSDLVSIFWAAGLQVVGAWYIATETSSELKQGGYVQGTVILLLRKRPAGERAGFKQRLLPAVRQEVDAQIRQMLHLNDGTAARFGAPVFNDADLQMAGYAAALKVLTGFTHIGGEDVTAFALRPRRAGETTVVDEIVAQAAETANGLLVPAGLAADTWTASTGIERFYLRMLDMERGGVNKLDNYQNFAKAFRVADYQAVMASCKPNAARLKAVREFTPRDLTDRGELGPTRLGALLVAVQGLLADADAAGVLDALRDAVPDYLAARPRLIDLADYLAAASRDADTRRVAEALAARIRNQRL